jgi:hypothetical protein
MRRSGLRSRSYRVYTKQVLIISFTSTLSNINNIYHLARLICYANQCQLKSNLIKMRESKRDEFMTRKTARRYATDTRTRATGEKTK